MAAAGGGMAVFDAVNVGVSLGGGSAQGDFAGEGFVTGVGEWDGRGSWAFHGQRVGTLEFQVKMEKGMPGDTEYRETKRGSTARAERRANGRRQWAFSP